MKKFLDSLPKFVIGPLAVIAGIVYFTVQDPPKSICDIQFEIFRTEKNIVKYIYPYKKKSVEISPEIKRDLEACQNTNSPGGCFDWMEGLKRVMHASRNIPGECRDRLEELSPYKKWLDQSLFTYSQISWNDATIVRKGLYHWLESDDIMMFCRLKTEYTRLFGADVYKTLEKKLLSDLQKLKKLPPQQTWERTILSYRCPTIN